MYRYPEHKQNDESLGDYRLKVCADCYMEAHGQSSDGDPGYALCREWEGWALVSDNDDCGEFSHSTCDGCHDQLGGMRWTLDGHFTHTVG